jgi:hypothetical protein
MKINNIKKTPIEKKRYQKEFQHDANNKNIEIINRIHPEFEKIWWFIAGMIIFFGLLAVLLFGYIINMFLQIF